MTISELSRHVGGTVTLKGWLYHWRKGGKIWFLVLRDGSGYLQCVVSKADVPEAVWEAATSATQESTLEITGVVKADPRSPGGVELGVTDVKVLDLCHDFPITPKEHGVDFLMSQRHLWLRSSKQVAVLKVRSEVESAIHDFYHSRGYTKVDSPILTPNACEGTSNLFETQYTEDEKAYLSQSGQLYLEPAAAALGKVYCFGPTFRAEKSKTRRHLTEFWMVEPEIAFAHLDDAVALAEGLVCYVVAQALEKRREDLKVLERDVAKLENVKAPFPRLHYKDAMALLQARGSQTPMGSDFGGTDETVIAGEYDRPVVVHRFPSAIKAFYMAPDPEDPQYSLSADILAPEGYGEIVGGGERLADAELLLKRIHEHQLPEEAFRWYLDLRRFGSFPHAGFGMGIERVVTWICGIDHLRETIAFPRMLYRIYP